MLRKDYQSSQVYIYKNRRCFVLYIQRLLHTVKARKVWVVLVLWQLLQDYSIGMDRLYIHFDTDISECDSRPYSQR